MNNLVRYEERTALSAADMREHVNLVQEVMKAVMKKDVHYGVIPGTPKPTLYKAGAEVLCTTFRIAPKFLVEDLSTEDRFRYRIVCQGVHQTTGILLAEGLGSASSNEEKHKWRAAVCDEEFNETPENRRRIKYKEYQGNVQRVKQIRTENDIIDNTVLKMACKRAHIAMTLSATAASDCFSQDMEDLPEELRGDPEPDTNKKQSKTLPVYGSKEFVANLPKWKELIDSGKKTADHIIAQLSSRATLTEEQKTAIRAPKQESKQDPQKQQALSYSEVADSITKAADSDTLNDAATLISAVADEQQRRELTELYHSRRAELEVA